MGDPVKPIVSKRRHWVVVVLGVVFAAAMALWLWTLELTNQRLPTPAISIRVPGVMLQAFALPNGLHFQAIANSHNRGFEFSFERMSHLGGNRRDYGYRGDHDGLFASALGFAIAVLPRTFNGGDYILSPFAAMVLPYWALIVGSGLLLARRLGLLALLAPYSRPSKTSGCAAATVLFVFLLLNLVPSTAWVPGRSMEPDSAWSWAEITFWPWDAYNEIALKSGFPLECYRRAFIGGQPVDVYYGDDTQGLDQHRMMENVCIALLGAWAVVIAIEWVRHRVKASRPAIAKVAKVPMRA